MALVTVAELLLKLPLMHPQQLRKKAQRLNSSRLTRRTSGMSISYLKTRIRGARLQNAASILVLVELTHRLHQAYRQAYDKQVAEWLLPQNPPQVGGTKDKGAINDFNKGFQEAVSRLDDADCAKLFGGKEAALKALYGASYSYRDLGPRTYNPDTQTVKVVGAATISNTTPQSVYINTNGPFRNTTLLVVTPSGAQAMTVDFGTRLRGAEFGSLLLLHELGHLTGVFKADAGNDQLNRSYTQQVQDACFKKK